MKKFLLILTIALTSCKLSAEKNARKPTCYWMENISGKYQWVTTSSALGNDDDEASCYAANSCGEGLSRSGGGCYKWATGADKSELPWSDSAKKIANERIAAEENVEYDSYE